MIVIWLLCLCSLGYVRPVASSHFMGGMFRWRPVNPEAYDGNVQITHRLAWRSSSPLSVTCTQAAIEAGTILGGDGGALQCQSGCNGNIGDTTSHCTEFSVFGDWSVGERTYVYSFNKTISYFETLFESGNWITVVIGGVTARWQLMVKGNLTYREDTGTVNSSPVVNMPPTIHLQYGCYHAIKIPVQDVDGDYVRCRWAESSLSECGGVCRSFPGNLNERDCELKYEASGQIGRYAIALQVEDFGSPTDIMPFSSVPVQFVAEIFNSTQSCSSQPEFVGTTPQDGSCIGVPFNASWSTSIIARVSSQSTAESIAEIVTASPLGMRQSVLSPTGNPGEWSMNVTWTPTQSQYGPSIFCYFALDNTNKSSAQSCITLLGGVEPPKIIPGSMSPTGEIFSNHSMWSVEFDRQFIRSPRDRFIRIFDERGKKVLTINVATSSAITYPSDSLEHTLSFEVNYTFPEKQTFYILLDPGVAVGTGLCNAESPPLRDPTLWTFTIADVTPPRLQINLPVISNESITLRWLYDEETVSVCKLQPPSLLTMTTIPCSGNVFSLTNDLEGYSLFIHGTDVAGNVAAPIQLTWNVVTITCGNIKLVDIELETIPSTVLNTIGSMTIYHCAESISANQTVSSVCSSDGVSRWNPDPTSHACVSATSDTSVREECSHLISMISTPLAFFFGIVSGLLLYCCIKCMCPLCRQKTEQDSTIVNVQIDKNDDELVSNPIYCEVGSTKRYSKRTPDADVELEENLAYGHFETASDSYEDNIP